MILRPNPSMRGGMLPLGLTSILLHRLFTHHIQCGDTHELPLVIHTHLLQCLSSNGHSAVHRVGDDVQDGLQQWA